MLEGIGSLSGILPSRQTHILVRHPQHGFSSTPTAQIKKPHHLRDEAWLLVETAGIEPASASPLPLALHAYSDFNLTTCYPPDGEDTQRFRYLFSALAPNKPPSRFYESDAGMFRRTWTHRHGSSPTAILPEFKRR